MIAPPTSSAMSRPNIVTIGVRLARSPCLKITRALGQALRARGADVVLAERLEQVVARHPRVERGVEQREHDPGQDQVREQAGDARRLARRSRCRRSSRACRQKMKSAIRPSQKTGVEMPKSAKPIATRSTIVRRLTAEITPIGDADDQPEDRGADDQEERARRALRRSGDWTETSRRRRSSRGPGQPYLSPMKKFLTNLPNWTYHGLSRPRRWRICAMLAVGRALAGEAQRRIAGGQQVEDGERDREHARDDDDRPDESACDVEES